MLFLNVLASPGEVVVRMVDGGVEAAMNLAFNLEAGGTVGLSLSGVTPTEGLSQTSVLSETTSGSVERSRTSAMAAWSGSLRSK